jgi:hypothetical protein
MRPLGRGLRRNIVIRGMPPSPFGTYVNCAGQGTRPDLAEKGGIGMSENLPQGLDIESFETDPDTLCILIYKS